MGRIKTKLIKRITHKLVKEYGEEFTSDFEENKKIVAELADIPQNSKKMRNTIAGYTTRLVKARRD